MSSNKIRDTPEIIIPKGYTVDELMDFEDGEYDNGEPNYVGEVKIRFE